MESFQEHSRKSTSPLRKSLDNDDYASAQTFGARNPLGDISWQQNTLFDKNSLLSKIDALKFQLENNTIGDEI